MSGLLLGCAPADEPAVKAASLIGGMISATDPAVVVVVIGNGDRCSGSLIRPNVVLTAAHCFLYARPAAVLVGTDPRQASRIAVQDWRVHPEYDTRDDHADVALLRLAGDAGPPLPVTPQADGLAPGEVVRLVGFGPREFVERTAGQARISSVGADRFGVTAAPARPCAVDSGGPALAMRGGREVIVGVVSGGDIECARDGESRYSRLAPLLAGFVEPVADQFVRREVPPVPAAVGERCVSAGMCDSLRCLEGQGSGAAGLCTKECLPGDKQGCPAGFECGVVDDEEVALACVPQRAAGCSLVPAGRASAPPLVLSLLALALALYARRTKTPWG